MKDLLLVGVKKFLEVRLSPGKPLLLGYSGGPDSKALLYLLLECRRFFAIDLHLAHVDHGWREESMGEAVEVQAEADRLRLPLHMRRLEQADFSAGNFEDQGREHRLQFFSQLYNQLGCQALVLGHHADDQAEVVLKRVFEGASLFNLSGLSPASQLRGMQVWRPLLFLSKKGILDWLSQKHLNYVSDPTNMSKRFLRGRMREEMIPQLKASFGKEISFNLCRLGEESREVKEYFHVLNEPLLAAICKEAEGSQLNLKPFLPLPSVQLKHLLISWMQKECVCFSRQILEGVVQALAEPVSKKKFQSNDGEFLVENGIICFSKFLE